MNNLKKFLSSKHLVIDDYVIKVGITLELNLKEFLVLVYLINNYNASFDVELISKVLGLESADVMEAFNSLMIKGLVNLDSSKDAESRMSEVVNLDGFYQLVIDDSNKTIREEEKVDIYKIFEQELGRTISSTELELIDGWLKSGTSEDLIIGALKEAIYNGVPRFRYIDKIIYEWDKKGFKSSDDVNKYLRNRREEIDKDKEISKKEQDILEYDWIND